MTTVEIRDRAAPVLLLIAGAWLAVLARSIAYDDSWITYRYAWNLASGNGFVYNLGERFLGTSAPGYGALLALAGLPAPDLIPTVSTLICVTSLVAAGLGLYAFGRAHGDWVGGFVAGLLFVTNPISIEAFGGEMGPQLALVIWAMAVQARERWMLAVLLGVGATILRPDGLVPLGVIGLHQVWLRRRLPWREIIVAGVILAIWHGALWIYFGAPLPQTAATKSAQRLSGIWRPFGMDLVQWLGALTSWKGSQFGSRTAPGYDALIVLAALGLPALLWRRHWWAVIAWPVCYMLVYRQFHLPFYHWYAVPPFLAIAVCAGAAVSAATALVGRIVGRARGEAITDSAALRAGGTSARDWIEIAGCMLVALLVALPIARYSARTAALYPLPVERAYAATGRWFAANTPPGASIGYLEIGILGYHARRTLIDPLGLVNPGVAPHVAQRDFLWSYRHYRPDYIVHNKAFFPQFLGIMLDEPWFRDEYVHVTDLESGRGADIPLSIYRRVSTTPGPQ